MIPPIWVNFRFNAFWIPLPMFLFWPLLLATWLILGLLFTGVLLVAGGKASDVTRAWISVWVVLCSLRGTRIDLDQSDIRFNISII